MHGGSARPPMPSHWQITLASKVLWKKMAEALPSTRACLSSFLFAAYNMTVLFFTSVHPLHSWPTIGQTA
jgi:hypothetical protein